VGCDCDRYIEVWNVVFSQFNNDGQGNYTELCRRTSTPAWAWSVWPACARTWVSLFDVDTVMNITNKVSEITGAHYDEDPKTDVSLRVITDHIRSATMMICDGVLPSNEGRGYVLRRLLRRAARHGKLLGVNEPFLYKGRGHRHPRERVRLSRAAEKQAYITKVIRTEEENFAKTIDGGMKIFSEMLAAHKAAAGDRLLRRRRLQALRHLRLPHRPHGGDGGGAGHDRGSRPASTS
jgi:alanyl-tRNA synthetase